MTASQYHTLLAAAFVAPMLGKGAALFLATVYTALAIVDIVVEKLL